MWVEIDFFGLPCTCETLCQEIQFQFGAGGRGEENYAKNPSSKTEFGGQEENDQVWCRSVVVSIVRACGDPVYDPRVTMTTR
jgi:hypothetical protein